MIEIDKNIIKQRFSKSITTYNHEALVQKAIAQELITKIMANGPNNYCKVLEVGCGTGFLTAEFLKYVQPDFFVINDLVDLMAYEIEKVASTVSFKNWSFIAGDAENTYFEGPFDLVISSSTLQWFNNPKKFFNNLNHSVINNGIVAFTTYGENNFTEIRTLLQHGLDYPTMQEINSWLPTNFERILTEEKNTSLYFDKPIDVLKHIKGTGVNGIGNITLNKQKLLQFENNYIRLFANSEGKVSLTYNPITVLARKQND